MSLAISPHCVIMVIMPCCVYSTFQLVHCVARLLESGLVPVLWFIYFLLVSLCMSMQLMLLVFFTSFVDLLAILSCICSDLLFVMLFL